MRAAHALVLQAQHDDHVGVADAFGHVVAHAHAHLAQVAGHQRLRADGADLGARPACVSAWMSERATRECTMSPTIATVRLREVLLVVADRVHVEQALRRVRMAPVAGIDHVHVRRAVLRDQVGRAALAVAHDEHVGMHRRQVGDGVEQALALGGRLMRAMSRLMTSADSRLAAISKVVRVRVLFSKNRLNTLLPRSSGTFFTSRSLTLRKVPAVSRICVSTACGRPSIDSRWISSPWRVELRVAARRASTALGPAIVEAEAAGVVARQRQPLRRPAARRARPRRRPAIGSSRPPRSTSTASVHAGRAAEVEQLVDHRADRAAGVEHVVDQQDVAAVDVEGQLGARRCRRPGRASRSRRGAACSR